MDPGTHLGHPTRALERQLRLRCSIPSKKDPLLFVSGFCLDQVAGEQGIQPVLGKKGQLRMSLWSGG